MSKLLLLSLLSFSACGMKKCDEQQEGYAFKSRKKQQEKDERPDFSFITQYRHHENPDAFYTHNFTLKDNQILHISSEHELVVNHDTENNRIDVTVKVRKDSK